MNETRQNPATEPALTARRNHWMECVFAVLATLLFSRAMLAHLLPPDSDAGATLLKHALFFIVYAVSAVLLLTCWKTVFLVLWQEKSVLLLGVLALCAPAWSDVPEQTLRSIPGLLGALLFGVYLTLRLGWRARFQVLAAALALAMIASLCMGLLNPAAGVMHGEHEGLWRGAFAHKNMLGKYAVLAGAALFVVALSTPAKRHLCLAFFWLSFALLLLAASKGAMLSWVVLFLLAGMYLARAGYRWLAAQAGLSAALVLIAFALLTTQHIMPSILLTQGVQCAEQHIRNSAPGCQIVTTTRAQAPLASEYKTGSGRLALWRDVWVKAQERPVLGYAPGGFWRGHEGPSAYVWERRNWFPQQAHNGFLDLVVDFGLLGLGLLLMGLAAVARNFAAPLLQGKLSIHATGAITLLAALLLVNVTSGRLVVPNHLSWVMLVMLLLGLAREAACEVGGASSVCAISQDKDQDE